MAPGSGISEDEVSAFLDGELSPARRSEVQARLALEPELAAKVFAEAQRMDSLRSAQPQRLFPPRSSMEGAKQLEGALRRRKAFGIMKVQVAAALLIALGWTANSLTVPLRQGGQSADETFILSAREALRVAQLDAGPSRGGEPKQSKIERLAGHINISMPQLPTSWRVIEVQLQPWNESQRLVVTANTPSLGQITLVAAPMTDEDAVPLTPADDGRIPTVYWQSGGTAYALMGPVAPDQLEREAKGIEVATRKNSVSKVRG